MFAININSLILQQDSCQCKGQITFDWVLTMFSDSAFIQREDSWFAKTRYALAPSEGQY